MGRESSRCHAAFAVIYQFGQHQPTGLGRTGAMETLVALWATMRAVDSGWLLPVPFMTVIEVLPFCDQAALGAMIDGGLIELLVVELSSRAVYEMRGLSASTMLGAA